jgi:hypothetical protein
MNPNMYVCGDGVYVGVRELTSTYGLRMRLMMVDGLNNWGGK